MLQQYANIHNAIELTESLHKVLAASKTGFLILNGNLDIKFCNDEIQDMFAPGGTRLAASDILAKLELSQHNFDRIFRCICKSGSWIRLYEQQDHIFNISITSLQKDPASVPLDKQEFLVEVWNCSREFKELQQLNGQKMLALEKNRLRSELCNQISHELKTPLHAIMGFSEHIKAADNLPEEHASNLDEILGAGKTLLLSINEMIEMSRYKDQGLVKKQEHVDIEEVFQECMELFQKTADNKKVRLIAEARTIKVFTDKVRLKQALMILVSNAIAYNHHGGKVMLYAKELSMELIIQVIDTGKGIVPSAHESLFAPFQCLTSPGSGQSKTGLGLLIAKNLVKHLNGSMHVVSHAGMGSLFWLRLPLNRPQIIRKSCPIQAFFRELYWVDNDRESEGFCRRLNQLYTSMECRFFSHQEIGNTVVNITDPCLIVIKRDKHGAIPGQFEIFNADNKAHIHKENLPGKRVQLIIDQSGKIESISTNGPVISIEPKEDQQLSMEIIRGLIEGAGS